VHDVFKGFDSLLRTLASESLDLTNNFRAPARIARFSFLKWHRDPFDKRGSVPEGVAADFADGAGFPGDLAEVRRDKVPHQSNVYSTEEIGLENYLLSATVQLDNRGLQSTAPAVIESRAQ